jgi:predicted metal-dependent phosphoesterase TrpH
MSSGIAKHPENDSAATQNPSGRHPQASKKRARTGENKKPKRRKKRQVPKNLMPSVKNLQPKSKSDHSALPAAALVGGSNLYPENDFESKIATADFHMHSMHSDGLLTPTELINLVARRGIKVASLTDHDTMAGLCEAIAAGIKVGVRVIPGVEISATASDDRDVCHVLAYFPTAFFPSDGSYPPQLQKLEERLQSLRTARLQRAKRMLEKLDALGVKLDFADVLEIAGEAAIGRPHIARLLLRQGKVSSMSDAFNRYLGFNGPAYVEGEVLDPSDAVRLITEAGGLSVLAHPWCLRHPSRLLQELTSAGLDGVEIYNKDSDKASMFEHLAVDNGLLKMGGSDYHGDRDNERSVGDIALPVKAIDDLFASTRALWRRFSVELQGGAGLPGQTSFEKECSDDALSMYGGARRLWRQLSERERQIWLSELRDVFGKHVPAFVSGTSLLLAPEALSGFAAAATEPGTGAGKRGKGSKKKRPGYSCTCCFDADGSAYDGDCLNLVDSYAVAFQTDATALIKGKADGRTM